jgi:hypothetical protein
MAMRYSDTTKWDSTFFRKLSPKLKCAWEYICDTCDGVGVLRFDLDTIAFKINDQSLTRDEFEMAFEGRVLWLSPDKIWIPGFLPFHHKNISAANKINRHLMHKYISLASSVDVPTNEIIEYLDKYNSLLNEFKSNSQRDSYEARTGPVPGPIDNRIQNIDNILKIIDNRTLKRESAEREIKPSDSAKFEARHKFNLNHLYEIYPRAQKKAASLSSLSVLFSGPDASEIYPQVEHSFKNYRAHCERESVEFRHMLTLPNFLLEWRDWLDPKNGTSGIAPKKDQSLAEYIAEKKLRESVVS